MWWHLAEIFKLLWPFWDASAVDFLLVSELCPTSLAREFDGLSAESPLSILVAISCHMGIIVPEARGNVISHSESRSVSCEVEVSTLSEFARDPWFQAFRPTLQSNIILTVTIIVVSCQTGGAKPKTARECKCTACSNAERPMDILDGSPPVAG